jgi:hypothetical protein
VLTFELVQGEIDFVEMFVAELDKEFLSCERAPGHWVLLDGGGECRASQQLQCQPLFLA